MWLYIRIIGLCSAFQPEFSASNNNAEPGSSQARIKSTHGGTFKANQQSEEIVDKMMIEDKGNM